MKIVILYLYIGIIICILYEHYIFIIILRLGTYKIRYKVRILQLSDVLKSIWKGGYYNKNNNKEKIIL